MISSQIKTVSYMIHFANNNTFKNLSIYVKGTVCTYVPFSRPNRRTNLHQILHKPLRQLREGS